MNCSSEMLKLITLFQHVSFSEIPQGTWRISLRFVNRTSGHTSGFDCHHLCYQAKTKKKQKKKFFTLRSFQQHVGKIENKKEVETVTVNHMTLADQKHAGEISDFCKPSLR